MANIAFSLLENGKHCILLKRKWRTLHSLDLKMANIAFSLKENGEHCILFTWKWQTLHSLKKKMANIAFSLLEDGQHVLLLTSKCPTLDSPELKNGQREDLASGVAHARCTKVTSLFYFLHNLFVKTAPN